MNKSENQLTKELYLRFNEKYNLPKCMYDYINQFNANEMSLIFDCTTNYISRGTLIDKQNVKTYLYKSIIYRVRHSFIRNESVYMQLLLRE